MTLSPLKEYLKSSVITFVATFAAAILPMWGGATFDRAGLVALAMVGLRAGIKAILEMFVGLQTQSK